MEEQKEREERERHKGIDEGGKREEKRDAKKRGKGKGRKEGDGNIEIVKREKEIDR